MDKPVAGSERELFDEAAYQRLYPDIADAIAQGHLPNAWTHYEKHGRQEGRKLNDFDEAFYLSSYPAVRKEIAEGRARSPFEHYRTLGRYRGYICNAKAPRADNAAALPSRFGGLWTDRLDAGDIIDGRLETNQITERQAERLRSWRRNGYVILEQAIPPDLIGKATRELDRAYSGGFPELLFECHAVSHQATAWRPEHNEHPAKALDLHYFTPVIRELMFADAIAEFLGLIFEAKAFASQSLSFLLGSAQEGHQDSAYVAYTIPRQFAASWIALEDVTLGAGELFYYPGSHRFPDYIYSERFKNLHEAERMTGESEMRPQVERHVQSLVERAEELGLKKTPFAAKKGDALIWHADLVHGGNPVSNTTTRKSVVTHYCPKHLSPLYAEGRDLDVWDWRGHRYTTGYYSGEPMP